MEIYGLARYGDMLLRTSSFRTSLLSSVFGTSQNVLKKCSGFWAPRFLVLVERVLSFVLILLFSVQCDFVWLTMLRFGMVWHGMVWHGTNGMVWRPQIRRYGVQRWPATALHTTKKGELRKENNSSEGTKSDENFRFFVFFRRVFEKQI